MTALCGDLLGCKCQDLNFLGGHLKRASREQIAADKGHLHFSCTTCDPPLDHSRVVLQKSVSINWLTNFYCFQVYQTKFKLISNANFKGPYFPAPRVTPLLIAVGLFSKNLSQ